MPLCSRAISCSRASRSQAISCSRASRSRTAQPMPLPSSTRKNKMSPATESAVLFRRANFLKRYAADGGHASTGSSFRYRWTSAAKPLAVS